MEELGNIAQYAGPMSLAAFAGTLLGGIALSFFWKNFGPWKLLQACQEECKKCHEEREADHKKISRVEIHLADLSARYTTLLDAVERGGLGLQLGPHIRGIAVAPPTNPILGDLYVTHTDTNRT